MKKPASIVLIAIVILAVFIFFPGKYHYRKFNPDCEDYCKGTATLGGATLREVFECNPPLDGFSVFCVGISKNISCEPQSKCFLRCDSVCFGLVMGTGGAPNPIEAKLDFVKQPIGKN
jgi:hypothetical protein